VTVLFTLLLLFDTSLALGFKTFGAYHRRSGSWMHAQ